MVTKPLVNIYDKIRFDTIYVLKNGSIQENYSKLCELDRSHVGFFFSIGKGVVTVLYVIVIRWTIWTYIFSKVNFIHFLVECWFF